jgi:hypothetical protein
MHTIRDWVGAPQVGVEKKVSHKPIDHRLPNIYNLSFSSLVSSIIPIMSFFDSIIETLNKRKTGPIEPFDSECPATRIIPRRDLELFVKEQQQVYGVDFYNRTLKATRLRNYDFLELYGNHDGTTFVRPQEMSSSPSNTVDDEPVPEVKKRKTKKRFVEVRFVSK